MRVERDYARAQSGVKNHIYGATVATLSEEQAVSTFSAFERWERARAENQRG